MADETEKVCKTGGCERGGKLRRGMCGSCYLRAWKAAGGTGKTCSVDGCHKPLKGKGLCNGHYWQKRRGQELRPLKSRAKVDVPWDQNATLEEKIKAAEEVAERTEEGCLVWPASRNSSGYGRVRGDDGKKWLSHRAAYFVHTGKLRQEDMVHHTCGRGAEGCFNIDHLQVTTHRENTAEMVERAAYRRQLLSLRAELDDLRFEVAALDDFLASCGLEAEYAAWCAEQEENDLDPPA